MRDAIAQVWSEYESRKSDRMLMEYIERSCNRMIHEMGKK